MGKVPNSNVKTWIRKSFCCFVLFMGVFALYPAFAVADVFEILDPAPDSPYFIPYGIDGSKMVGRGGGIGYIYNRCQFETFEMPDARYTLPYSIDGRNVVGIYGDSSGNFHNFLYDGSNWNTIDMPGGYVTNIHDIDDGKIVGTYNDIYDQEYSGPKHGFVYDGLTWTTIDVPGATQTCAYGISNGRIVGSYSDYYGIHGFIYDGCQWTTLDMPGSNGYTICYGVDGDNIVGSYSTSDSSLYAFLYDGSEWKTLDIPNVDCVTPHAISGNYIVGECWDNESIGSGFIYTIPEPATICFLVFGSILLRKIKR